jgi:phosphate transport system substrate-binding protein
MMRSAPHRSSPSVEGKFHVNRRSFLAASGAVAGLPFFAGRPALSQQVQIKGCGATFPRQVFEAWSEAGLGPTGIKMTYDGTSSAEGLAKCADRVVDFAATVAPTSPRRLQELGLMQFPSMVGPVVFTVNLPGVAKDQLRLTGDCVADLYMGKITKWNDPKLKEHNPGLALPDLPVTPIHRSDSTGTTLLTTTYLSRASEAWRNGPKVGNVVQWPVGKGGHLNAGVADLVKATPGAIGYVKNAYAAPKNLTTTQLRNHSGDFVKAERPNFYAAIDATDWTRPGFVVDMIDLDGANVWPVIGPCYTVICTNPPAEKVETVRNTMKFFDWAFNKGDDVVRRMGNASLPDALNKAVHEAWVAVKDPSGRAIWGA